MLTDTRKSPNASLHGLAFDAVEWTDGLYKERFMTCADATVPHLQKMFESSDISHVLENFRIAAGEAEGDFDGTVFGDGDFYKWMEAAAYTAVRTGRKELLDRLEDYIGIIGRAQQPDGYISTKQIIGECSGKAARLGDINDFEVYNFGHLFTSACLYFRLTGRDNFLQIAERAAVYLRKLYGDAEKNSEVQTAVCPSHYMGLAELYRTTGKKEYLELLKTAVKLRDSVKEGLDDNQDRLPLKEHDRIIGHAVRANYLYAGVADLCLELEDKEEYTELIQVLAKVWKNLVTQKMYITGGCGALYNGASPYGNFFHHQLVHQAYGYEYQLPNITAYNETCASIGGVYWAWRMLCLEKSAAYADVLERMVLNVNLAAVSLDGRRFFYENILRRAHKLPYELVWGQERCEYILSYCCPPNLARMIAQLSEYAYAADEDGLYTVLYGANRASVRLSDKAVFDIVQETAYPYDGVITFSFPSKDHTADCGFLLHLRIPSWVRKGTLTILRKGTAEKVVPLDRKDAGSYLTVQVHDLQNTQIVLDLGMEARLTCAHPLVEETNGQIAVERGPLVYCMEGMDTEAATLDDLVVPADIRFETQNCTIDGRTVTALQGTFLKKRSGSSMDELKHCEEALYRDYEDTGYDEIRARMIPYFAWDNRGTDEMKIWMPVTRKG